MYHTILLYGKPYSGKTTFASQFPKPFAITFDNNARYALDKDSRPIFTDENTQYVKNLEDYLTGLERASAGDFETIIIDPLDLMGNMVREKVLKDEGIEDESEKPNTFGRPWRLIRKIFETLLTEASKFDGNVIFISWENEREEVNKLGTPVLYVEPSFNKKLITHVTGLTSEIAHAKIVETKGKQQYAISLGKDAPYELGSSRVPTSAKMVLNDYEMYMNNFLIKD